MASKKISRLGYGKKLRIEHNPDAKGRQPRYTVMDVYTEEITHPQGVTTILSEVLAKDLVGWALDMFEDAILQKLNSLLDDEPLTTEDVAEAKQASNRKRNDGAASGSKVHALIEAYLKGEEVTEIFDDEGVTNAFAAFVKWYGDTKPKVLGVEQVVYSQMYKYAGCCDALLEIDGKVYLTDWKTTSASKKAPKGIYPEMFIQLGGYAGAMIEEAMWGKGIGKLPKIDGLMVVSVKKDGKLDVAVREDVDWCAQIFRDVISIKEFIKETEEGIK